MNSTAALQDAPNASSAQAPRPQGDNGTAVHGQLQDLIHVATLGTCAFLLALVFCLGSYGNFIVFLSFFDPAFRKFRTNFDFLILNLSFCDLFICGVTAPMFTFVLLASRAGGIPDAFCFTFHLTSSGFTIMSLKTVAVIALHRLRMVLGRQPDRTASLPCTVLLTLLLWATSFTLATLGTLKTGKSHLCLPMSSLVAREGRAILSLYMVDFSFCVTVVSVSYIMIAQTLRKNAQARKCPPVLTADAGRPQPFAGAPVKAGGAPLQRTVPALYRNQTYNKLPRVPTHGRAKSPGQPPAPAASRLQLASAINLSTAKDSKAVLTCVVIVLSVLVCCLPLGIALLQVVLSSRGSFIFYQFELLGFTLIFLKSGLNPFIYSRNSAGLRRRVLWCLQHTGVALCCRKQKTRLRAVGKGNLEVNRNKSSHHETNSAYMLSPKAQRRLADQACGPSHSKDSVVSPKVSAGHQPCGQSCSTPINTRMEPYYSVYHSSPSREGSSPAGLPPVSSYIAVHYHATTDLTQGRGSTAAKPIPAPSV
ncbi:PREDICTED: probable G-protein coupled receptor 75 [Chinchilla lanigera]|uniref:G protein-coupled receptor 75 n=1 Tax=Chinchilla lanigera TaxID=34839 RepID=A0A8C2W5W6_CHILA|nr:PREDICTED: probable G-protein coupled receptor 75 [Chinchilla lanigera]